MGKKPKGFENLDAIAKLFIEEMDKGKDNTLAAFSTAASNDDGLKVENLVGASPATSGAFAKWAHEDWPIVTCLEKIIYHQCFIRIQVCF